MKLKGKLAIITGAGSGIGLVGCELFAKEGAQIVAVDRDISGITSLVSRLPSLNGKIHALEVDLSNEDNCTEVVAKSLSLLGGLDILWGNAGIVGPGGIEDVDSQSYADTININLRPNFILSGKAVEPMRQRGGGSMLFTSSISGIVGSRKSPAYAVTKHALVGLVRSLAISLGQEGIRVNALCPGVTETPMLPSAMGRGLTEAQMLKNKAEHIASIPLGRVGESIEMARAALWLLSDDASYVTGITLPVDGGYTCG